MWDRHVIANMGAELGATTTVFPSDTATLHLLADESRETDFMPILPEPDATYDEEDEIDLSALEPLIALPSSPGNVVQVREVAGREIYQAVVGSSANPGLRDFAIAAEMVRGNQTHPRVSFDVNPTSRQILELLIDGGWLGSLVASGARVHQAGCMGCIGMGQAPGSGTISLRTVPRNFPGRSGIPDDQVYLCSPETATASALTGVITDPRDLGIEYPKITLAARAKVNTSMLVPPGDGENVEHRKGPNIVTLPRFDPLPHAFDATVLLVLGDDVSTDEILPAGSKIMALRSNIPEIARFTFSYLDDSFFSRATEIREAGGASVVVGGRNFGQGSSREHAALALRYLGVRVVLAESFARIHGQNLVNFGIAPLTFKRGDGLPAFASGDIVAFPWIAKELESGDPITLEDRTRGTTVIVESDLSGRQRQLVAAGGVLNSFHDRV